MEFKQDRNGERRGERSFDKFCSLYAEIFLQLAP